MAGDRDRRVKPKRGTGKIKDDQRQIRLTRNMERNNQGSSPDEFSGLRREAERKLPFESVPIDRMSEADVAAMVHELRIRQEELKMQNKELRGVQTDLEESRSKYTELFDFAPIGYLIFNADGRIEQANLTVASMLQIERGTLCGTPFIIHVAPLSKDTFRNHYQAVFKTGQSQRCEVELRPQDEALLMVRLRSRPVKNGAGKVIQCRTAMTNVTALARTERRLKESERRFRTLAENAPDIIARIDRDMRVLYVNRPIEDAVGIPTDKLVGRTFEQMGVPDDTRGRWTEAITTVFNTGQAGKVDFDGSVAQRLRHYSAAIEPEFDEQRKVNTVIVTVRDVTDRVQAEEKYSAVIRSLQDGFCIIDTEGRYVEMNDTCCRMLGRSREELLGMTVRDIWEPEQQQTLMAHLQEALEHGWDKLHMRHRRKDGSRMDCDITIQRLSRDRLFVFARDITAERVAEEQIAFQAHILKDITDAVIAIDNERRVTYWNQAAEQLYEIPVDEAIGQKVDELYRCQWPSQETGKAVYDALEQSGSWQGLQTQTKRNGEELIVRISLRVVKNEAGDHIGYLGVIHDETQERLAQEDRMRTLRRLELVGQATNDGIWDWDVRTDVLWHNDAYATAFGYDPDEASASPEWWRERIHPEDREMVFATLDAVLEGNEDRWTARYRFRRKDGSYAWVMARAYVLRDRQSKPVRVAGSMLDLTEKLELLDQLESERSKLGTILEAALVGIVVVDNQARITYANPAAQSLSGRPVPIGEPIGANEEVEVYYPDGRPYDQRQLPIVRSALDGETYSEVDILVRWSGGRERYLLVNTSPLRSAQGEITGAVAVLQDVTQTRQAEQALREAHDRLERRVRERTIELDKAVATLHEEVAEKQEAQKQLMHQNEMLQKIIDNIPVMLCFYDAEGNVGMVNDEFTRVLGYLLKDLQEHNPMELRYPDPAYRRKAWDYMLAAEPGWRDFFVQRKQGGKVTSSWANVRLSDGSYLGIGIDIRERKRWENRLRESEERYRTLVELSPDAIGVERDGMIQFVNSMAVTMLGADTAKELLGRSILDFVHPDHRRRAQRQFRYLRRRRKPLALTEQKIICLDGTPLDVEMAGMPITFENKPATQIVMRDITRRKEAEARLQESARQLQQQAELLDLAHDSIVVNDMDGRIVFWNRGAEQTFGWTRHEAIGKISHELLRTRFPLNLIEITSQLLSQGRWNGELTHTTRTGETIIVSSRWVLQRDTAGRPAGILAIDRDITQQKRAEHESIEARRFAESITDTIQESLLVLDQDFKVLSANQTFYQTFRVPPAETEGHYVYDIDGGQWDIPELRKLLDDILPRSTSFEHFEVEQNFEHIGHRTMQLNARRIYREAQETEMILLAIRDITVRKEQEKKIHENQRRLATLTEELLLTEERERHRLAVMLHDSIGQSLSFSKRELGVLQKNASDHVKNTLEYVKQQIDEAIRETRSLTFELSPTTLHTFGLEAAVEELAEQFAERGAFQYHFQATEEDKPLTEQIKTLLFRAARELLTNVTKHAEASNVFIRIDQVNTSIRMVMEDDGKGFDTSRLEHVFGQQKGFGLFSIRERLTYVGGAFSIESRPGEGTKVTLLAPLHRIDKDKDRDKEK